GVLSLRKIPTEYKSAEFPLGWYVDPGRGRRGRMGLPSAALAAHAAVVAPSGSGKTTSIIVPWAVAALRAGWSVLAMHPKGDPPPRAGGVARASGQPVGVPSRALDYPTLASSEKWNWCAELDSDAAVSNAVDAILGKEPPARTDPFFWARDKRILQS